MSWTAEERGRGGDFAGERVESFEMTLVRVVSVLGLSEISFGIAVVMDGGGEREGISQVSVLSLLK